MAQKLEKKYAKGSVNVNGIDVDTYKTEIGDINILEVEAGTTGYCGGDTGHGGRTYFRVSDLASTDMRCRIYSGGKQYELGHVSEIEIMFGGDSEMDTFCEALRFGVEVIGEHASGSAFCKPSHRECQQLNFALYINDLCELYRKIGSLKGKSKLREKYHVTDISIQDFFECELHKAQGRVSQAFCDKVYDYILDTTKATAAPKYSA